MTKTILAFYKFLHLKNPQREKEKLAAFLKDNLTVGTIILSNEGINGMCSLASDRKDKVKSFLEENFTLKSYDNPNLTKVVEGHDDFIAAKFDMFEISVERDFVDGYSMILGFGNIDANELDHPYYTENSSLGRVKLIPETFYYAGITFPYFDGIVSGKISKQENLISTTRTSDYNTSNYTLNFTKKFSENSDLLSINLEGNIEGTSDHKVGLTYRKTY